MNGEREKMQFIISIYDPLPYYVMQVERWNHSDKNLFFTHPAVIIGLRLQTSFFLVISHTYAHKYFGTTLKFRVMRSLIMIKMQEIILAPRWGLFMTLIN